MTIPILFQPKSSIDYEITIDELPCLRFDKKVAIITNPTVAKFHLETLLSKLEVKELHIVEIPDGEAYKNMESIEFILDKLFSFKLDRKSMLIAFGGGVIGDMTGFCASLYQRGIDFIQIPTTLLSQVDASVGGKTGVNNKYGKNLIGTFYQPKAVYIDPDFLDTLPSREFAAGVAEMIKIAVTFDADYFKYLQSADLGDKEMLKDAIARAVTIKADVVAKDEKESGIRAVLNYGHTFAHVIENETNYSRYLHGEAVSIGIIMANALAYKLGLLDEHAVKQIQSLLEHYDLPTEYMIEDIESFYEHFFLDKKSANDKITFVLPKGIGDFELRSDIDKKLIKDVLRDFGGKGE
ncbi:MAG: 3-dehydroquinate synthase [Campylobacterales bacterium]|nr:3-dehydroquinate synthase [Campylobacterales bacterium]